MTNEELVALIQSGERDKLPELWEQVERFVALQAHKRLVLSGGLGGVEFGDLYNAGYLALVAAADTYDPNAGRAFIGWLALSLKTAFAEAGGYRSRKQARDPLHRAGSMDAPVGDENDTAIRACLKSSNEDGNESKSKHLGRNKEFALTIFPKSAELVEPAK